MEKGFPEESESAERQIEKQRLNELAAICERIFPEIGLESADLEKVIEDAQGDYGDALGAVYGLLLENGEDPDELLAGLEVLEEDA